MPRKLTTAQAPFKLRVANLAFGSDPSRGPIGNPVKVRSTFETQILPQVPGRGDAFGPATQADATPGLRTLQWTLLDNPTTGIPIPATGTIDVVNMDFSEPAWLYLSNYALQSGDHFTAGVVVQATGLLTVALTPSAANITLGAFTLTAAVGPRTPGADDYDGTLGTTALIAADILAAINDPANSFIAATVTAAAGPTADDVALTAVPVGALGNAVALASSTADVTVSGATLTGGADADASTASNLAAAISNLPGFSATSLGTLVTVTGPVGPAGNTILFEATYEGSIQNFTLTPSAGVLTGAEPILGPVEIG